MNKTKHLEMIQTIVNRLAGNSFLIKGWCVTLVAAVLALAAKDHDKRFIAVAYYPVLMFWILDSYFLYQERLFRKLYDAVRLQNEEEITFSMDTSVFRTEVTWLGALASTTLILFYLIMTFAILLSMVIVLDLV